MRQFMRENGGQAGLVGKNVNQPTADHDRVTDAESFEGRGQEHAGAYWPRKIDVVGDLQIVYNGLENMVDVALGRKQSSEGKPLNDVIFRLLLPYALRLQRRRVLRCSAVVLHAVDTNLREFVVLATLFKVIAPDAGLGFERDLALHAGAEIAFFAVDVSRNPVARDQVQPPAVHVEEVRIARSRSVGSVQAHDVEALILNPHAAQEAATARALLGCHVEHEATDIAEKFAADVVKVIVLAIKVGA